MNKVFATLDPHRCDAALDLSFGNLVVRTKQVCDIHRMVMGTIALGVGNAKFECRFFSTSFPAAGLANLCSVGVASADCALNKYVGEEVDGSSNPMSFGLRTSDGAGVAGIYAGNAVATALQAIPERFCIGVFLYADPVAPYVAWQVDGNFVGQHTLPAGKFWVPAVSIGSSASPDDVAAYVNFGQRGLDFPASYLDI